MMTQMPTWDKSLHKSWTLKKSRRSWKKFLFTMPAMAIGLIPRILNQPSFTRCYRMLESWEKAIDPCHLVALGPLWTRKGLIWFSARWTNIKLTWASIFSCRPWSKLQNSSIMRDQVMLFKSWSPNIWCLFIRKSIRKLNKKLVSSVGCSTLSLMS